MCNRNNLFYICGKLGRVREFLLPFPRYIERNFWTSTLKGTTTSRFPRSFWTEAGGAACRSKCCTKLSPITVRSKDGFAFNLDVAQIIHIGATDAPKVISRVGSVQNLVDHVLQPIVGNYFRNSAQKYTVLDFLSDRSHRQAEATEHICRAIRAYDVQALDTLISDITPPAELMATQTARKIAEEQRKTYEVQQQEQRQELVRGSSGNGLVDGLLGLMVREQVSENGRETAVS